MSLEAKPAELPRKATRYPSQARPRTKHHLYHLRQSRAFAEPRAKKTGTLAVKCGGGPRIGQVTMSTLRDGPAGQRD